MYMLFEILKLALKEYDTLKKKYYNHQQTEYGIKPLLNFKKYSIPHTATVSIYVFQNSSACFLLHA